MIYVHVPFCKSFCVYCGFYSEICTGEKAFAAFADGLCREITERSEEIKAASLPKTLYFGGGTPSVLPLKYFSRIVEALPGGYEEFTVEANPDDINPSYASGLKSLGVNRISLGVQSLSDEILRLMNRRHDSAAAIRAVETLRHAGIDNISIDLIFGLPSLAPEVWDDTITKALALSPNHISAYQLSVEEGSVLDERLRAGSFKEAGDEECRQQYDMLCRRLSEAGYIHYEVSNFAKPGFEAIHNSAYWRRSPYVGLGPGAHSFDGSRLRSWNTQSLNGWKREYENLSDYDTKVETIMLSLRTAGGISETELFKAGSREACERLLAEGALVRIPGGKIRIPENHFFVCDDVITSSITSS